MGEVVEVLAHFFVAVVSQDNSPGAVYAEHDSAPVCLLHGSVIYSKIYFVRYRVHTIYISILRRRDLVPHRKRETACAAAGREAERRKRRGRRTAGEIADPPARGFLQRT